MSDKEIGIGVKLIGAKDLPAAFRDAIKNLEAVAADRPGGGFGSALGALGLSGGKDKQKQQVAYRTAQAELKAHYAQQLSDIKHFFDERARLYDKSFRDLRDKTAKSYQEILRLQKMEQEGPRRAIQERAQQAFQIRGSRMERSESLADLDRVRSSLAGPDGEQRGGLRGFLGGLETGSGLTRFGARAVGAIIGYKLAQAGRAAIQRDQARYGLAMRMGDAAGIRNTHGAFADQSSRLIDPDEQTAGRSQFSAIAGSGGGGAGFYRQVASAQEFGIGMGLGPEAGVANVAAMKRIGAVGDEADQKKMMVMFGEVLAEKLVTGKPGEVWQAILGMSTAVMRTSLNAPNYADTISLMTRLAMTGQPGAQGTEGLRIMGGANAALSSTEYIPGIAGVGKSMVQNAQRRVLRAAGMKDPFEIQKKIDEGYMAKVPGTGQFLGDAVLDLLKPKTGIQKLAVAGGMGQTAAQAEALFSMHEQKLSSQLTPGLVEQMKAHPSRLMEYSAALRANSGNPEAIGKAFDAISLQPAAGENKIAAVAMASEAVDKAFRDTLIPVVDATAQAFVELMEKMGGPGKVGGTLEKVVEGLTAAYYGSKLLGKIPGVGRAAAAAVTAGRTVIGGVVGTSALMTGTLAMALASKGSEGPQDEWRNQQQAKGAAKWFAGLPKDQQDTIVETAANAGLTTEQWVAQLWQESHGNPHATSKMGAMGLAQIMPGNRVGNEDLYDPKTSIRRGGAMMKDLMKQFGGNYEMALAGYNSAPSKVAERFRTGSLPHETSDYIRKIEGSSQYMQKVDVAGTAVIHIIQHNPDGSQSASTHPIPLSPTASSSSERVRESAGG
jgi:hypothetical protein